MNKVILMGRLTKDPELRYSQSTEPVAIISFSLAVPRKFKRQNEPEADFLNCVSFGKTAENISKFFRKGRMIAIAGRIQTGSYENKEGMKVYTTDIVVDEFYFTGEKKEENKSAEQQETATSFVAYATSVDDEDLPF